MKPFKTFDEQLEIIKNRGLIIEDEEFAKQQLALYNYYNIINGYKDIFVEKDGAGEEKYKTGVRFAELLSLFDFDIKLRKMFLQQILRIESVLKTTIAYVFAKNHEDGDYLNKNNFNTEFEVRKNGVTIIDTDKVINKLGDCLAEQQGNNNEMICHYINNYGKVPIWVFVNVMTLGLLCQFYSIMTQKDQTEVCKQLSKALGVNIFHKELSKSFVQLVHIRNRCAHNRRMYDINTVMQISTKSKLMQELKLEKQPKGLFMVLILIRNLSRKEDFKTFFLNFVESCINLLESIVSIDKDLILKKMGLENMAWLQLVF